MKITRRQLRNLIREEAHTLQEQQGEGSPPNIPWDEIEEKMVAMGGYHIGTRQGSCGEIRMYIMPAYERGDQQVVSKLRSTGAWDMGVRKFRSQDQTNRRIGRNLWELVNWEFVQIGINIQGRENETCPPPQ